MLWLALGIIVAIMLFSPLGIDILYLRHDNTDKIIFTLRLFWGALKIPINVEKAQEEVELDFSGILKKVDPAIFQRGIFLAQQLKGRIKCRALQFKMDFSLKDAALTGMAAGLLWSSAGVILALLRDYLKFKTTPVLKITPVFENHILWQVYFFAGLEIKAHTALWASLTLLKAFIEKKWSQFWQKKAQVKIKMKEG